MDALTNNPAAHPPASTAWLLATSLLRDLGIALVVYGALTVVAAWLAGPSRPAVWVRRRLAPAFRGHPVAVFSAVGVVLLIVLAWAPLGSGRRLFGMLLLAALILAGVELLRRQTLREFPEGGGGGPPHVGA